LTEKPENYRLPSQKGDSVFNRFSLNARLALRNMMRAPAFAATVLATLALGTGTTIAMFGLVDATLIRPLPYPNSERLVAIENIDAKSGPGAFAPPYIDDLRRRIHSLDRIVGFWPSWSHTLTGVGEPRRVTTAYVTDGLFDLLGVGTITGRTFLPDEYLRGANPVTVVSRRFWNRHFGPGVALNGQVIRLSDQPFTIVGIVERDFRLPNRDAQNAEIWLPFSANPYANVRTVPVMIVVGRLASGTQIQTANSELVGVAASLAADYPDTNKGHSLLAGSLHSFVTRSIERTMLILFGAVASLLLIVCANIANLLFARGSARQYELAVRRSLGATRRLILEQLFAEAFVIGLAGSLIGLLLVSWTVSSIPSLGLKGLPATADVRIDFRLCAFAALIPLTVTVIFGFLPALQLARRNQEAAVRRGPRTTGSGRRFRELLIVGEVALTMMLLVGAGLLARSFWKLSHVDPGFNPEAVLTIPISLPTTVYSTDEQRRQFFAEAVNRVRHLPGATKAAAVNRVPLSGANVLVPVEIEGNPERVTVDRRVSMSGYFDTLGVPVLEGRDFGPADGLAGERTAILNRTAVHRFFPDGRAVGKRLRLILRSGPGPWARVVGIVGDIRHHGLDQQIEPEVYVPYDQAAVESMVLLVRTNIGIDGVAQAARGVIWGFDRNLPLDNMRPLHSLLEASLEEPWSRMLFLNGFAVFALLLAGIGLYGVVSYSVTERRRDIGIRLALGARPGHVLRLIVMQGLLLAAAGIVIGLSASAAMSRMLTELLFGITPMDLTTLVGVTAILTCICAIASYVPARCAIHFDPVDVLRAD
jgi:putative ABC transport system permease protein